MEPLETASNLQKISFLFFLGIGMLHILSGLFLGNNAPSAGETTKWAFIMERSFDIPFLLVSLLYGFSSLYIQFNSEKKPHFAFATVLFTMALIILSSALYVNFFIPDL
ncbi:hypothetical protein HYV57_03155 [Candidatus Peregrinibacteria bacterium]|nr:hypothetical protein [Candidatus Peregrinibacteria bacterium]